MSAAQPDEWEPSTSGLQPRPPQPPPRVIPEIQLGPDLDRVAKQAIHLLTGDDLVFARAGRLVRPIHASAEKATTSVGILRPAERPRVIEYCLPSMARRLSLCAHWMQRKGESWYEVPVPDRVTTMVLSDGEWPQQRRIAGIVTAPTLRPDGSVLQKPGYDTETALLYRPDRIYPTIDSITPEDVLGARTALLEPVSQFPFASESARSTWLALLLTLVGRHMIRGPVPLFAFDASTPGSGKTRLVDVAMTIAHGARAARTVYTKDEDEMRKRITSMLLEADPCVLIDNVAEPLGGPVLDALLTSERWKDRLLGSNVQMEAEVRTVLCATGNNMNLKGDMHRRTLWIRLETELERPDRRKDLKQPRLLQWLDAERGRLMGAALTILLAFHAAGRPTMGIEPWYGFEEWNDIIGGCIRWLGLPCMQACRAETGVLVEAGFVLPALLEHWHIVDPTGEGVSASQAIRSLYSGAYQGVDADERTQQLKDAIEMACGTNAGRQPDPKRLGYTLRNCRARVLGGRRFINRLSHGMTKWRVEQVATQDNPPEAAQPDGADQPEPPEEGGLTKGGGTGSS